MLNKLLLVYLIRFKFYQYIQRLVGIYPYGFGLIWWIQGRGRSVHRFVRQITSVNQNLFTKDDPFTFYHWLCVLFDCLERIRAWVGVPILAQNGLTSIVKVSRVRLCSKSKRQLINFYSIKITICDTYFLPVHFHPWFLILILVYSHSSSDSIRFPWICDCNGCSCWLVPASVPTSFPALFPLTTAGRCIGHAFDIAKTTCARLWDSCSLLFMHSFSHSIRCGCVMDSSCWGCSCDRGCGGGCCSISGVGVCWWDPRCWSRFCCNTLQRFRLLCRRTFALLWNFLPQSSHLISRSGWAGGASIPISLALLLE